MEKVFRISDGDYITSGIQDFELTMKQLLEKQYPHSKFTVNEIKQERDLRATGKTTRYIDSAIQELFKEGVVEVNEPGSDQMQNLIVFSKIKERLVREHGELKYDFRRGGLVIEIKYLD